MKTILLYFLLLLAGGAAAQQTPDSLKYCLKHKTIGVGGYDPLTYFEGVGPKLGEASLYSSYDDVTYFFSTAENKKKFDSSPSKYIPQFGGWCSMTLAMGRATTPKYDNYIIESGRLYLFERTLSVNGRELWVRDLARNKQTAERNYEQYVRTGKIK